jgi:hypothetical protein
VLLIELTRHADGGATLRCRRADGSATWQRHAGRQAAFFPLHDLTHYAVESTLGERAGFFGLLAAGWEIADTGGKGARGALPRAALRVEHIVGFLDGERASGGTWSAAEFEAQLSLAGHGAGDDEAARPLTDASLARIRARRAELFAAWAATEVGATLALRFTPGVASG